MYEIATLFKLTEKIHNYISSHFSQVYDFLGISVYTRSLQMFSLHEASSVEVKKGKENTVSL
jgi:hypothetical protein